MFCCHARRQNPPLETVAVADNAAKVVFASTMRFLAKTSSTVVETGCPKQTKASATQLAGRRQRTLRSDRPKHPPSETPGDHPAQERCVSGSLATGGQFATPPGSPLREAGIVGAEVGTAAAAG
jgi:hypothetical protein